MNKEIKPTGKTEEELLNSDPDYIRSPKYDNSLNKLLEVNPNGVPDSTICKVLKISQEELDSLYQNVILKLRAGIGNLNE